jgi:hypothetical protein
MNALKIEREDAPSLGSRGDLTNQVRDNLAARLERMEAQQPEVLDFQAEVIAAGAYELRGALTILCPPHIPVPNWREAWRGLRDAGFLGLARIFTSTRPEAKAAADSILSVLARRRGYALTPEGRIDADAHEAMAALTEAGAALLANLTRDLKDGRIDATEAAQRLPELRRLKACVSMIETLIETAQRRTGR